uniref:SHSP domain-containing protein n=1 Tax=Globodera rostochiensis TaxID=31243 RepID=A0A914HEX5_GLORO
MFGNLTTKPIDGGPRPQPNSKDREKYIKDCAQARSDDLIFAAFLPIFMFGSSVMLYLTRREQSLLGKRQRVPFPVLFGVVAFSVSAFFYRISSTREVRKAWTDKYGKEPFYRRALRTSIGHSLFAKLGQMEHELDRFFDGVQPQLVTTSHSGPCRTVASSRTRWTSAASGEQHEQKQGESVHRQFSRRVLIPEGIQKESIKCKLDWGRLCITGMKTTGYERRSIPIDVKKAIY